jgi:torulene dioxygenase
MFHKFFTMFKGFDASNVEVRNVQVTLTPNFPVGDKLSSSEQSHRDKSGLRNLYAKTDSNALRSLDSVTLDPIESTNYTNIVPDLTGSISASHAASDPDTGELFNYSLKFGRPTTYKLFKLTPPTIDKPAGHKILATITDAPAAYIHSVCLTKKYFIFCAWQADYKLNGATIPYHRNLTQSFRTWNPKRKALWYVIDREEGGVVRKFESDTFFAFHHINSYDDGDNIIVDLSTYATHEIVHSFYLDVLQSSSATQALDPPPLISRVVLSNITASKSVGTATITTTQVPLELPTISSPYSLRHYKYAYGASTRGLSSLWDCILKVDLEELLKNPANPEGAIKRYERPKCTPSEPIFVPRPGATREDDGVVLVIELDGVKGKSALVVIDAMSFKEIGRAEVESGEFVVPHHFHGAWCGNNQSLIQ